MNIISNFILASLIVSSFKSIQLNGKEVPVLKIIGAD